MLQRVRAALAWGLCLALLWMPGALAWGQKQKPKPTVAKRARLVLLIAVDQFRYDFLERFNGLYSANGIGLLLSRGASWTQANYDHTPTYTAPGHATMLTGAWPSETGIIANEWPDFAAGQRVSSVADAETKLLGGAPNANGASPRRLMASTLGDELRLMTGRKSKVLGISIKDRSAILPAGRNANAAYWFGEQTGTFVSSTYYFPDLPKWVASYNAAKPAQKFCGQTWNRLLPEAEYLIRAGADAPDWESRVNRGTQDAVLPAPTPTPKKNTFVKRVKRVFVPGNKEEQNAAQPNATPSAAATSDEARIAAVSFPHKLADASTADKCYRELAYTPFGNDLLLAFAQAAITNEALGADDYTDILSVSFSANDYVGHRYGPYSQEAMDISLRVDRTIGKLLDFVDRKVGLLNTVVVFTADHGVAPPPEQASAMGLPGGRIPQNAILDAVRKELTARFKYVAEGVPDNTRDYIGQINNRDAFDNGNLYFNQAALRRDGFKSEDVENAACRATLTVPGIARCFTRAQLERSSFPDDPIGRRVQHGFYARRNGDIIVLTEPFKYLGEGQIVATHGSPYSYDTHVPLILFGAKFKPGRYYEAATPADIAPTLSQALGVPTPSNSVGRVLREGLR